MKATTKFYLPALTPTGVPARPAEMEQRFALLLSLPVAREEFLHRVTESDWLAKLYDPDLKPEEQTAASATRWENEYFPFVAGPLERLIGVAKTFGAQVKQRATIEDLSEATRTSDIVILFAH